MARRRRRKSGLAGTEAQHASEARFRMKVGIRFLREAQHAFAKGYCAQAVRSVTHALQDFWAAREEADWLNSKPLYERTMTLRNKASTIQHKILSRCLRKRIGKE